ncbi:hypothetical protein Pmani_037907 [Petrolisthes manimaculis]|uniref:Uncharacterized protein n=1 Tax=Petrolisthes manimaculis TaxID=1843537 RepID=A0AAE1NGW6_9EUCA|nr:hypothetical protein Pmani_037907 [Petrolisthes manimaculis]
MAAAVSEKSTVHYTVSSPVNNLPSFSSPPAIDFLHISRFPFLPGLHLSYFEGKLSFHSTSYQLQHLDAEKRCPPPHYH